MKRRHLKEKKFNEGKTRTRKLHQKIKDFPQVKNNYIVLRIHTKMSQTLIYKLMHQKQQQLRMLHKIKQLVIDENKGTNVIFFNT